MTALNDAAALIAGRHAPIVTALGVDVSEIDLLAGDALAALGVDGSAALEASVLPSLYMALDVCVWRWVEMRAALGYDFSADGGSYQRSQLFTQASKMRQRAEEQAARSGLEAFAWPAVEYEKPVNRLINDEGRADAGLYQW